jgi:hypothetical protein
VVIAFLVFFSKFFSSLIPLIIGNSESIQLAKGKVSAASAVGFILILRDPSMFIANKEILTFLLNKAM